MFDCVCVMIYGILVINWFVVCLGCFQSGLVWLSCFSLFNSVDC